MSISARTHQSVVSCKQRVEVGRDDSSDVEASQRRFVVRDILDLVLDPSDRIVPTRLCARGELGIEVRLGTVVQRRRGALDRLVVLDVSLDLSAYTVIGQTVFCGGTRATHLGSGRAVDDREVRDRMGFVGEWRCYLDRPVRLPPLELGLRSALGQNFPAGLPARPTSMIGSARSRMVTLLVVLTYRSTICCQCVVLFGSVWLTCTNTGGWERLR